MRTVRDALARFHERPKCGARQAHLNHVQQPPPSVPRAHRSPIDFRQKPSKLATMGCPAARTCFFVTMALFGISPSERARAFRHFRTVTNCMALGPSDAAARQCGAGSLAQRVAMSVAEHLTLAEFDRWRENGTNATADASQLDEPPFNPLDMMHLGEKRRECPSPGTRNAHRVGYAIHWCWHLCLYYTGRLQSMNS